MSINRIVPVSEARDRLTELLADAAANDVILVKHGHPVGVLLSMARYEHIIELAEDMEDIRAAEDAHADEAIPFRSRG